jgi:putative ABC transport system permease protein
MFKNMLKRSWLSIVRKPSRSIILVLILFVMANMLLATVSIKNSVDKSMDYAKEKIGGIVYLQADTEAVREKVEKARESGEQMQFTVPTISETMAKGVADSKYIKDYTYSIVANANAGSYKAVETAQNERERQFQESLNNARDQVNNQVSEFNAQRNEFNAEQESANGQAGGSGPTGGMRMMRPNFNFNFNINVTDPTLARGDTSVQGINSFDFISDVEAGNMKIVEGKKFDETTKNGVVISNELAEANSLKVGSEMTFKRTSDSAEIKLTVVGIYQTSTEDFNYNTVYANIDTAKQFYTEEQLKTLNVQNVRYYLTSASDKDAFLAETNVEYKDLGTQNLKLDIDDSSYQTMVGPIEQVGSFSVTILWIVIIATVAIVTLIVVINVKDRRYEMGVLLSLGAKKSNIVGQIFVELILVGTIAFGASLATSQILAQKMGEGLLQQQVTASEQEASENESTRGANAGPRMMMLGGQQQTNVEQIDKIDVSAGVQEYATLFGIGYLILVLAMILPSVNVLRYQPKTILTGKE